MIDFAARLALVLKALAMSRGRLASQLAVDKSVVSRWLSGATTPGNHNMSRLTALIAESSPGFTMLDWEVDEAELVARLGVAPATPAAPRPPSQPDLAALPSIAGARRDTAARAARYCGVWRLLRPMMARPAGFVLEHVVIRRSGDWLGVTVHNVIAELPGVGFIADGQLYLLVAVQNAVVSLLFNRVDDPIIDQVDGLILSPTLSPGQTPCASRMLLERIGAPDLDEEAVAALLADRAGERRLLPDADLPDGLAAALLPDCGPTHGSGGERLLRAAGGMELVRSRWS